MKKSLFAAAVLILFTLSLSSASAEPRDCWYYARNGRHDFEQTNFYYPTCTQDGYYVLECRICGLNEKHVTMPASGHEYGDWKTIIQATESSTGTRIKTCSLCGDQIAENFYPDDALYRGSLDSDGILELQMMLSDCGYLNDSIDGVFGKNTETAVKAFQQFAGLPADGIAWPQTLQLLEEEWERVQHPYLNASYPSFCYIWQTDDGTSVFAHCQHHWEMYADAMNMLAENEAESMLYSYLTCQAEIIRMYDEWIALLPEHAREAAAANKALCLAFMEAQKDAMFASYDALNLGVTPSDTSYGMELWMRSHTAWLCQMIHSLNGDE